MYFFLNWSMNLPFKRLNDDHSKTGWEKLWMFQFEVQLPENFFKSS